MRGIGVVFQSARVSVPVTVSLVPLATGSGQAWVVASLARRFTWILALVSRS